MSEIIKLSSSATNEFWEIPVLYEDQQLMALAKPSGLFTSPDRFEPTRPNLMKLLHRDVARGASWVKHRQIIYLANAHRLDFETSGVLLLAKDKATLIALANQFGSEKPEKTYVALVRGAPSVPAFEVNVSLAPHLLKAGLMRVDQEQGKRAKTLIEIRERFEGYTLLQCRPLTERTHQIRLHLQSAGFPLVGDSLYGGRPLWLSRLKTNYRLKPGHTERPLMGRVALHGEKLRVSHPVSGEMVTITAPWPKDLTVAVKYLRRFAPSLI